MARLTPLHPPAGTLRSAATLLLLALHSSPTSHGFTPRLPRSIARPAVAPGTTNGAQRRGLAPRAAAGSTAPDLVVISPPGGIGEIASIESALLGGSVRWFVVSAPGGGGDAANVALTAETLSSMERAGGSIELAGASADTLLMNGDGADGTSSAVAQWCRGADSILCTYDGVAEEKRRVDRAKTAEERGMGNEENLIKSAVRVAAREAVRAASRGAVKVAVLGAEEELMMEDGEKKKGGGGLLQGLFAGKQMEVPETLGEALMGNVVVVRHGELFGASASSPESSPFIGGPRIEPIIRDMYTMRSIRIDPTISLSGNILSGEGSKTNRLSLGEAASRLALRKILLPSNLSNAQVQDDRDPALLDLSLTSFRGTDPPTEDEWQTQFARLFERLSSPSGGATLFTAEFGSVPNVPRLAEWIASKWAPAILRSYDIAGTRVGARPVYAVQTEENVVEIVWQELVDFQPVTSGRMVITVEETGLTAARGKGDETKGFGKVSRVPLPGEDILVRRLGDAASQAVEKGLATKAKIASKEKSKPKPVETKPVAAVVSAPAVEPVPATSSSESGPRSAGARRSSERSRGRRKDAPPSE
ncbi:hypothetical protein ACHAXS_011521, partial [Conticribra weissflogii]